MENLLGFIELYKWQSLLITMLLGLLLGVLAAYLWWRQQKLWHAKQQEQTLTQLNKELGRLEETLKNQMLQHQHTQKKNEGLNRLVAQLETTRDHLQSEVNKLPELQDRLHQTKLNLRSMEAELVQKTIRLKEQQTFIDEAKSQLKNEFSHLGQKILDQKSQKFSEQNQKQIQQLVRPIHEQLKLFSEQVTLNKIESVKQSEALKHQLTEMSKLNHTLSERAENLTQALTAESKTQGNWGEMVLQKLLDLAGLEQGREYQTEVNFSQQGERKRPDVVIHLPDEKSLIVDAKVSLTAYQRYVNTNDQQEKQLFLKQHLQSLQQHISGLSAKNYQHIEGLQTVDFVLMFVPIEGALMTAINNETDLLEKAYRKNILLVSATNLLATLRTVHMLWQNDKQNKNAREIAARAGKLIDKFAGFYDDFNKIHHQLSQINKTWEQADNKLRTGRGNLYSQISHLDQLGAQNSKQLPKE